MQPTPEEINQSLGNYLKRSREGKNVSIEQVAYATRISLKMLRALEDDDHTSLPAPTFVRGYLQAYAKYVRLDTQDLLLRYQHHLATVPDSKRGAIRSHYLYVRERYQEKRRLVLVIALFALMLAVAGAYFFLKAQREKKKQLGKMAEMIQEAKPMSTATATMTAIETAIAISKETKAGADKDKAEKDKKEDKKLDDKKADDKKIEPPAPPPPAPVVVAPPPPAPAPPPPPPPVEHKAPEVKAEPAPPAPPGSTRNFNLLLRATEDVWFRYQTDSDEVKDLTLRAGKAMMLRADKVVKIFSGNLNAMKGTLNGKELPVLAAAKGVKSLVLPETEAANHPLPLFPQFQTKAAVPSDSAGRNTSPNPTPAPIPTNSPTPPSP